MRCIEFYNMISINPNKRGNATVILLCLLVVWKTYVCKILQKAVDKMFFNATAKPPLSVALLWYQ